MQSIVLDTYSLHSLTVPQDCMVKSVTGLGFPDVRLDSYNRPGQHGQTVAHNLYGGRLITIEGTLRGADEADYLANRLELEAAVGLKVDANNVPIARTLFLTTNAFEDFRVDVVTRSFKLELDEPSVGRWQLQLTAMDYVLESTSLYSVSLTLPISGGVLFPVTFPITFGASSGGSATAANAGNTAAYPLITIAGPVINPVITNESTGASLALNVELVTGDIVAVDMKKKTIIRGGATNLMSAKTTSSKFWSLLPGNNSLRLSADAYDVGTATVAYRHAFLGL